MSKANEKLLGDLHGAVARVLTDQVQVQEDVLELDEDGIPRATGEVQYSASPATLATAIKFLKDNSITCDIKVDTNMGNLAEALANKQRHSRLASGKEAALKVV